MRNRTASGIVPRLGWDTYSADAMAVLLCRDGTGADLSEENALFNTADYSGTATNLWAAPTWGVQPAGDGIWTIQSSALLTALDFRRPGRHLVSIDLAMLAAGTGWSVGAVETILQIGAQNTGAGNAGNRGGMLQLNAVDSGATVTLRILYRDGESEDASGSYTFTAANATTNITSGVNIGGDGTTHNRSTISLVVLNEGGDRGAISIAVYLNGTLQTTITPTLDGTQRPFLNSNTCVAIGGRTSGGTTGVANQWLGQYGSGAKLSRVLFWYSETASDADVVALITELAKYRNERPRGL